LASFAPDSRQNNLLILSPTTHQTALNLSLAAIGRNENDLQSILNKETSIVNTRKFWQLSRLGILTVIIALSVTALGSLALAAGSSFFQGFETDTSGWFGATRVASGTNGIMSASGSWHAEAASGDFVAFTRWGGYGGVSGCSGNACAAPFPANGYITSIDIYLDADSLTSANDTRFDFSSAINHLTETIVVISSSTPGFTRTRIPRLRTSFCNQRKQQRGSKRRVPQEPGQRSIHHYRCRLVYISAHVY
jgi:hypothetical protein